MKDILKGSLVIFIFKVFGAISLFLIHILISRYYGAETLGVFNLVFSLLMIAAILAQTGLDIYVVKTIPMLAGNPYKLSLFLKEVIKIILIGGIAVSIIFIIIAPIINTYIFKSIDAGPYLTGLIVMIVPFTLFNVLPEILRGFHEIKIYSFFRNLSINLTLLIFLAITILAHLEFFPVTLLYIDIFIVTSILILTVWKFLKKHGIDIFVKGTYKSSILKYSYPMFLTSSIMFLMGYVDSFMISYFLNEYQVGIYSACIKLSFLVTFVLTSINGYIAPKISHAHANQNKDEVKEIYNYSLKLVIIASTPIFLVLYLFPEFFLGLFGEEFKKAVSTLVIINTAFLINALCGSVGYILNMTDNQHVFMKILIMALVINVVLNAILIPIYGINGAAIATLISMGFWNLSSLFILKYKKII